MSRPGDRGCSFFEDTYSYDEIVILRPNGKEIGAITEDLPAGDWQVHDWGEAGLLTHVASYGSSGDPEDGCENPTPTPDFVLGPAGGRLAEIPTGPEDEVLALSPDGTSYLFSRGPTIFDQDLYLGDLDSTQVRRLVRGSAFGDWGPSAAVQQPVG